MTCSFHPSAIFAKNGAISIPDCGNHNCELVNSTRLAYNDFTKATEEREEIFLLFHHAAGTGGMFLPLKPAAARVWTSLDGGKHMEKGTPIVTEMKVIPVAGRDSMLMTLSGAHAPCFTRNLVLLKDNAGHTGIGELHHYKVPA